MATRKKDWADRSWFINNGGDMETLYLKTKLSHCKNIIISPENQFILTLNDVKKGIKDLIETRQEKKQYIYQSMYL